MDHGGGYTSRNDGTHHFNSSTHHQQHGTNHNGSHLGPGIMGGPPPHNGGSNSHHHTMMGPLSDADFNFASTHHLRSNHGKSNFIEFDGNFFKLIIPFKFFAKHCLRSLENLYKVDIFLFFSVKNHDLLDFLKKTKMNHFITMKF